MLISVLRALVPSMVVAAAVLWWLLRKRSWPAFGLGLAWSLGVLAGALANTNLVPLIPRFHWHWMPVIWVAAAVLLVAVASRTRRAYAYGIALLIVAVAAAWRIVPTWPELAPRPRTVALLAGYLAVVGGGWWTVARRVSSAELAIYLVLTQATMIFSTAAEVSVTFAELSCFGLGASLSIAGVLCVAPGRGYTQAEGFTPFAWVASVSLALGLSAFVSAVEPMPPNWAFLGIPLAPLLACIPEALWRKAAPGSRRVARAVLVLAALALSALAVLT